MCMMSYVLGEQVCWSTLCCVVCVSMERYSETELHLQREENRLKRQKMMEEKEQRKLEEKRKKL